MATADALCDFERWQFIHWLWLVYIVVLIEVAALLNGWITNGLAQVFKGLLLLLLFLLLLALSLFCNEESPILVADV